MKITFKQLGGIKNAVLELNDLTIIAGANNTGKTYITYTLYGLLRSWEKYVSMKDADTLAKELIKKGNITLSTKHILGSFDKIVQQISKDYSEDIPDVFNDKEGNLAKASVEVSPERPGSLDRSVTVNVEIGETHKIQGRIENDSLHISLIANDEESPPSFIVETILNSLVGRLVFAGLFPKPFIATAERLGISLFYKELDISKNVIVEELQRLKKEEGQRNGIDPFGLLERMSSWYATPIRDNIHFTRNIGDIQKRERSEHFKPVVDKIIAMMGGYFRKVDKIDKEIRFISRARKDKRFDIPLYLASASGRGLTDLYFFLRYIAKEGMMIMIDEPESHLSPGNQIEMARLLARCVNAGLKVFITTHSDYLIKEFNNLIMLSNDFDGKEDFLKRNHKLYATDDFLKPGSIAAYICEQGKLKSCVVDKKGMDITSFDKTIDEINRISDELDDLTDD